MNVNMVLTKDYEDETLGERGKNKPTTNPIQTQSNPIKANKMPKQTQYKANTNPIKANTNPIKANKMPKQTQYKPNQTQFCTSGSVYCL
jgi:hypothetical protein